MLPAAGVDVEAELVSPVDGGQDDSVEHCACRPLSFVVKILINATAATEPLAGGNSQSGPHAHSGWMAQFALAAPAGG